MRFAADELPTENAVVEDSLGRIGDRRRSGHCTVYAGCPRRLVLLARDNTHGDKTKKGRLQRSHANVANAYGGVGRGWRGRGPCRRPRGVPPDRATLRPARNRRVSRRQKTSSRFRSLLGVVREVMTAPGDPSRAGRERRPPSHGLFRHLYHDLNIQLGYFMSHKMNIEAFCLRELP